jgi:hypothetical protein
MEIRKEMVKELVKFTRGDLQVKIVQSIECAGKKKEKLDWRILSERALEAEILQGMRQTDIKYQNTDAKEIALQKLYNMRVSMRHNIESAIGQKQQGKSDHENSDNENGNKTFSMKFPQPSNLTINEYPDFLTLQQELLKRYYIQT